MSDKPYVTYWISAQMAPTGKNVREQVKVGTRTVQKRKGMFNSEMMDVEEDVFEQRTRWVPDGKLSDISIDKGKLAEDIAKAANDYAETGYDLFQIIDCIEGRYNYEAKTGIASNAGMWGWGYGYGYSLTDGVIMAFRKRATA